MRRCCSTPLPTRFTLLSKEEVEAAVLSSAHTGSNTRIGSDLPLTITGSSSWNCMERALGSHVAWSQRTTRPSFLAVPISLAAMFTESPRVVYSRRFLLPTAPAKAWPVPMPITHRTLA